MKINFESSIQQLSYSPLLADGGYQVLKNLVSLSLLAELKQESNQQFVYAQRNEAQAMLPLPERGGQPSRRLYSGPSGQILEQFYHDKIIINQLEECTKLHLDPTGEQGSYSYYLHKGDFLSLHRDLLSCDVTLIISLYDQTTPESKGGMLCLYPKRFFESISGILSAPIQGAKLYRLKQGESLILLGGLIPHWVLPINQNESRVTALLCYRASELADT